MGLMQLMPETARRFDVADPYNPQAEHRGRHQVSRSAPRSVSASGWPWRPTTPAKRPSSGSAAYRRMPKRATMSRASCASSVDNADKPFDDRAFQRASAGLSLQQTLRVLLYFRADNVLCDNQLQRKEPDTVEFRCRLASPNGQVIEGVYSADSEARLRHELEEKGLFVLSLQPKGAIGGLSLQLPQSQRIPSREFLVFNQELATLLKAGHAARAVARSAEAACRIAAVPHRARRRAREGALGHARCRTRSRRTAIAFPACTPRRCWPASAAATSTPCCGATSSTRRSSRRSSARRVSALDLPGDPRDAGAWPGRRHRPEGRAGVRGFLCVVRRRAAAGRRESSSRSRTSLRSQFLLIAGRRGRRHRRLRRLGEAARAAGASRPHDPRARRCVGPIAAQVRDLADGAHAGDAARRRPAARQRARDRRQVGRQPVHGRAARHREHAGPRRASRSPPRSRRATSFRRSP